MSTELLPDYISTYLEGLVPPRQPEMREMEAYARKIGFPIIGSASGQLCYQVARIAGAKQVFEMGSGFGYSTAWFAKAVQENGGGDVYHVVWHADLSQQARQHLETLGFGNNGSGVKMHYIVSEAVQALKETEGPFDLIFNDIDKHAYPESLPVIREKLKTGGILIVDNLLWHGRIFDPADQTPDTKGVQEFTRLMTADPGWITTIVPIRDGVLVAYKV